jgi:copper oxidase (laccase) domain-containing protein
VKKGGLRSGESGMDLEKAIMAALFCAAGAVAYSVGKELRKRKLDRENLEREKAEKERKKAEKHARKKRSPRPE